jgi:hypothetical protein
MLDLSKQDPAKAAEVGFEFNIVLPDGTETDGKVKVRGKNSKIVQQFNRKLLQEMKTAEQAARRRGKDVDMTPEEAEELACRIAANRIISWSGVGKDGKEITFDPVLAEDILKEYPFLREQVMLESDNLLNFRSE